MTNAPPDLPAHLETARLILRPYRPEDAPAYYAVCRNNRAHLLPYEAGNPALDVKSEAEAEALLRRFADHWAAGSGYFWGAWDKTTGAFVAQIYVGSVDRTLPEFEIGFFADKDHEGRGFVGEAVRAVLGFVFRDLGAHRASLRCNDTNTRSARVAERCGFVREGHMRETNPAVRRPDGGFTGELIYGMLRTEFDRPAGSSP